LALCAEYGGRGGKEPNTAPFPPYSWWCAGDDVRFVNVCCRAGMVEERDLPAGITDVALYDLKTLCAEKRREGTGYGTVPALQLVVCVFIFCGLILWFVWIVGIVLCVLV